MIDHENKGFINTEDMRRFFEAHDLRIETDEEGTQRIQRYINRFDKDHDGQLNYLEFTKAITPRNSAYLSSYYQRRSPVDERDLAERRIDWIMELGRVIETSINTELILENIKNELKIDAESIFNFIDEFKLGYISTNIFSRWTLENLGYRLIDEEMNMILSRYDKDGDYRIKRHEFIEEVGASNSEGEGANE